LRDSLFPVSHLKTIVEFTNVSVDKTGTLTTGRAVVGNRIEYTSKQRVGACFEALQGLPPAVLPADRALWLACCAELRSEHPLGQAIVNAGKDIWGYDILKPLAQNGSGGGLSREQCTVSDAQVFPGKGVQCTVKGIGGKTNREGNNDSGLVVRVGNRAWAYDFEDEEKGSDGLISMKAKDYGGNIKADVDIQELRTQGQIGVYVSVRRSTSNDMNKAPVMGKEEGFSVIGIIGILDPVKEEATSTVAALKSMNIDVWMCTGDHELTAQAAALRVGIDPDNVCSNVKPEGKADLIQRLQKRQAPSRRGPFRQRRTRQAKHRIAVVGDGINDAVALARSDVGIAIGAGTEVAVEAADIVLVGSRLHDVVVALHLSRLVFDRIRLNFVWAMGYNLFALPFAAGMLYPLTNWTLPPAFAGLMMAFSSVSVVTSSLLLRTYVKPVISEDGRLEKQGCRCSMAGFVGMCYSCFCCNPLMHMLPGRHSQNKDWYGHSLVAESEIEQTSIV